jgi:hypothetical protein
MCFFADSETNLEKIYFNSNSFFGVRQANKGKNITILNQKDLVNTK